RVRRALRRRSSRAHRLRRGALVANRGSMKTTHIHRYSLFLLPALALAACSADDAPEAPKTDAQYEADVTRGMHDRLLTDIKALHQAALDIQSAAPEHAWDADTDADAIASMTSAWLAARKSYERTEGALAPNFPDIDGYIDARYDDFLESLGP